MTLANAWILLSVLFAVVTACVVKSGLIPLPWEAALVAAVGANALTMVAVPLALSGRRGAS